MFRSMRDDNATAQKALDTKVARTHSSSNTVPKLADMERQVANLKQQLEIERKIVPDNKEIEQFIKLVDAEGVKAGIEIRRYNRAPSLQQGVSIRNALRNGDRWALLLRAEFLRPLGKTERIVNVSRLAHGEHEKVGRSESQRPVSVRRWGKRGCYPACHHILSHDLAPPAGRRETRNSGRGRRTMRISMKLKTGKTGTLSTALLFVTLTAGSALAQIPNVVQHVQDQMNAVQQQKRPPVTPL